MYVDKPRIIAQLTNNIYKLITIIGKGLLKYVNACMEACQFARGEHLNNFLCIIIGNQTFMLHNAMY